MVSFTVLVGVRSFRSASKLSQMMTLLLGLGASIALRTPNANLVSFSPSSGSGSEQVFVATYIVPRGVTDGGRFLSLLCAVPLREVRPDGRQINAF